jgi:hypothetical protein
VILADDLSIMLAWSLGQWHYNMIWNVQTCLWKVPFIRL